MKYASSHHSHDIYLYQYIIRLLMSIEIDDEAEEILPIAEKKNKCTSEARRVECYDKVCDCT